MSTLKAPEPVAEPADGGRPKLKKLRLFLILGGLSVLALISTVFGMMMAVASDLPALENQQEYRNAENSTLLAGDRGLTETGVPTPLAKLTGQNNRTLVEAGEISPNMKNAVIAIEDRRFYEHDGVDYTGIARALWQDLRQRRAAQGGSTITQQFVKNALEAQGDRSVFQKLRESAMAYHLERQWSKEKILTQYLNAVYFGNGAYGVESAARTYFGKDRGITPTDRQDGVPAAPAAEDGTEFDPDKRGARSLAPAEAALLAGMIASPSLYDPVENPRAAKTRRDLVLQRMLEQGMLTRQQFDDAVAQSIPERGDIQPPRPDSREPYFTTWVTQQLVDRYPAGVVFGGGLRITTTLDPELQRAAEEAIRGRLAGVGPDASLVAIENRTGEVKALVGGTNFSRTPFNLATNGHRQPGSAFKPFILVEALRRGIPPTKTFTSRQKEFKVPNSDRERFVVNNYENSYSGIISLGAATVVSDNSVFAELGIDLGTRRVARLARRMGIRTRVSTNPAMTLGGLEVGVTPLELAFAYSTLANDGKRVCGSLASSECGPVAIERIQGDDIDDENERDTRRVFSSEVAQQAKSIMQGVVLRGTGTAAQIGEFAAGKTGTTENYGDAWFVGFNKELTVAVWVGYADKLKPMETEYGGRPVAGGTFPTEIWQDFMSTWINIRDAREAEREAEDGDDDEDGVPPPVQAPAPAPDTTPDEGVPQQEQGEQPGTQEAPPPSTQQQPPPEPEPQEPPPAPAPQPPPAGTAPQQGAGGAAPGAQ
ncbi:MAG: transglycosylase domain-containing protein [Thermoleophilaceae bacterium]